MLSEYGRGAKLSNSAAAAALYAATTEWKKAWVSALGEFYTAGPLSERVYICGPGARIPEARAAVQAGDWLGNFSHATIPVFRSLDGESFLKEIRWAGI